MSDKPTLAVSSELPDPGGASMTAAIEGELSINSKNCFEIDGALLIAPRGSQVLPDGSGVQMPKVGRVDVGSQLSASGGIINIEYAAGAERDLLSEWRHCLAPTTKFLAVISG